MTALFLFLAVVNCWNMYTVLRLNRKGFFITFVRFFIAFNIALCLVQAFKQ